MKMAQTEEAKKLAEQKKAQEETRTTQLEAQVAVLTQQIQQEKELKASEQTKILEKQQREEAVKLVEDADLKKILSGQSAEKVEDLTNTQLLDVIGDAVEQSQVARDKQLESLIKESSGSNDERLNSISKAVMQLIAIQGVNEAKANHPDFEEYKDDAAKLMAVIPSLPVNKAILLAKAERAGKSVPSKKVETERPDIYATRPGRSTQDDETNSVVKRRNEQRSQMSQDDNDVNAGIQGFRKFLREGLDKAIVR